MRGHVLDAQQAPAEMFGVLRPGGQIVVPTVTKHSDHGHQQRRPRVVMRASLRRDLCQQPWIVGGDCAAGPGGFTRP